MNRFSVYELVLSIIDLSLVFFDVCLWADIWLN